MNRAIKSLGLATLLGAAVLGDNSVARADNGNIAATIQTLDDLSLFYQAIVSSGILNELNDDRHYTIFAPTDAAFLSLNPTIYTCFYVSQCRPQIAAMLRNHIIVGRYDLKDLTAAKKGRTTQGTRAATVKEPRVGDYTVDGYQILSKQEVNGNIIYRINGVLSDQGGLPHFEQASYEAPADTLMIRRTISTYTRPVQVTDAYASASEQGTVYALPDHLMETTMIIRRTVVEP